MNAKAIVQQIPEPLFEEKGVRVYMKRDDLISKDISGNKWWKLKYNLLAAKEQGKDEIISFGGAFSNHIASTAAACRDAGLKSTGIIRGEEADENNPTLSFARSCGMKLHFVSRDLYRRKNTEEILSLPFSVNRWIIPEGGANAWGVKGCTEILAGIAVPYNVVCCACGTGTTLAGLVLAKPEGVEAIGFSVLKGGDFLYGETGRLVQEYNALTGKGNILPGDWKIETGSHLGGYAKVNGELLAFVKQFQQKHAILLDYIYTGKMLLDIYRKIEEGYFKPGTVLLVVHSGGTQGNKGIEDRYGL